MLCQVMRRQSICFCTLASLVISLFIASQFERVMRHLYRNRFTKWQLENLGQSTYASISQFRDLKRALTRPASRLSLSLLNFFVFLCVLQQFSRCIVQQPSRWSRKRPCCFFFIMRIVQMMMGQQASYTEKWLSWLSGRLVSLCVYRLQHHHPAALNQIVRAVGLPIGFRLIYQATTVLVKGGRNFPAYSTLTACVYGISIERGKRSSRSVGGCGTCMQYTHSFQLMRCLFFPFVLQPAACDQTT